MSAEHYCKNIIFVLFLLLVSTVVLINAFIRLNGLICRTTVSGSCDNFSSSNEKKKSVKKPVDLWNVINQNGRPSTSDNVTNTYTHTHSYGHTCTHNIYSYIHTSLYTYVLTHMHTHIGDTYKHHTKAEARVKTSAN